MSTTKKTYNENYVREAAYYCWQNAGCPWGKDEYFWNMAVTQLYGNTCSTKSSCCGSNSSCTSKKTTSSSSKSSSTTKKTSSKK